MILLKQERWGERRGFREKVKDSFWTCQLLAVPFQKELADLPGINCASEERKWPVTHLSLVMGITC